MQFINVIVQVYGQLLSVIVVAKLLECTNYSSPGTFGIWHVAWENQDRWRPMETLSG